MKILSRRDLFELVLKEPNIHNAIVIYEHQSVDKIQPIIQNCNNFLILEMNDDINERIGSPTKTLVKQAIESDFNIVSCNQGISRSSAIAYLIQCTKESPEEAIKILDVTKHYPNELILKFGLELLGERIRQPIVDYYHKLAEHKKWKYNLVTKYFL